MCTYLNPCLMFLASRCTAHTEWIPNKDESSIADVQLGSKCATKIVIGISVVNPHAI